MCGDAAWDLTCAPCKNISGELNFLKQKETLCSYLGSKQTERHSNGIKCQPTTKTKSLFTIVSSQNPNFAAFKRSDKIKLENHFLKLIIYHTSRDSSDREQVLGKYLRSIFFRSRGGRGWRGWRTAARSAPRLAASPGSIINIKVVSLFKRFSMFRT